MEQFTNQVTPGVRAWEGSIENKVDERRSVAFSGVVVPCGGYGVNWDVRINDQGNQKGEGAVSGWAGSGGRASVQHVSENRKRNIAKSVNSSGH